MIKQDMKKNMQNKDKMMVAKSSTVSLSRIDFTLDSFLVYYRLMTSSFFSVKEKSIVTSIEFLSNYFFHNLENSPFSWRG
jgi:hypothetical protein